MKTLLNNIDLNEALFGNSNIGFVPTMGSLHAVSYTHLRAHETREERGWRRLR